MINVEPVVVAWLNSDPLVVARVVTVTPADLVGNLPLVKVEGLGGPRKLNLGRPTVDVEAYAATRDAARLLAGQVCDSLTYRMRGVIAGSVVTKVRVPEPDFRPYDNPNVRRFGAICQVWLHDLIPAA